jgi:hypothetical protein
MNLSLPTLSAALVATLLAAFALPAYADTLLSEARRADPAPSGVTTAVSPTGDWQAGSPVRVVTTVFTSRAVEYVALVNRRDQAVVAVTLVAIATDLETGAPVGVFDAVDVDLTIPPRGFASVREPVWQTRSVARFAASRGLRSCNLVIGVARAVLEDGTVYDQRFARSAYYRFDAFDPASESLVDRLAPLVAADVDAYSRETAPAVEAGANGLAGNNDPKPTCVVVEGSRQKCKYTTVNGLPGCESSDCSRFGVNCNNAKCVMAIVVQPVDPPNT